jgi:V8-like Glu-specific endopeptidase
LKHTGEGAAVTDFEIGKTYRITKIHGNSRLSNAHVIFRRHDGDDKVVVSPIKNGKAEPEIIIRKYLLKERLNCPAVV